MAQDKYSFDGYTPTRQPSTVQSMWATTSTSDSGRNQFGYMTNKPLFSNEAFKVSFEENLYEPDMSHILQAITGKSSFSFHYYSPYYGAWRTAQFYVANIDASNVMVKDGREFLAGLSFQVTAINPL